MNTRTNKTVLLITLMICLATAVYSAVGTFTFRTSGASDTTEVVDLRYPQKVPEDASVTTDSIADGSITNDKLAEPVSVANGGTGATTAAEGLAALGGASLNGSSTVDFNALTINGVTPLTAAEKTQALVGSSVVDFAANSITNTIQTGLYSFVLIPINKEASTTSDIPILSVELGNYGSIIGEVYAAQLMSGVGPYGYRNTFYSTRGTGAQTIGVGTPIVSGVDVSTLLVWEASSNTTYRLLAKQSPNPYAVTGYVLLTLYNGVITRH